MVVVGGGEGGCRLIVEEEVGWQGRWSLLLKLMIGCCDKG